METREIIKKLCKNQGISVNKLETDLGFGTGYVSKLGKSTPNVKKIKSIADYFNVSVDYLMTGKENEKEQYSSEMAMLLRKIRNDKEMSQALIKYFGLSEEKKKHVVDMINMLSEV